jgi:hypothetical protein
MRTTEAKLNRGIEPASSSSLLRSTLLDGSGSGWEQLQPSILLDKHKEKLRQLEERGYTDGPFNIQLLEIHEGDVDKVAEELEEFYGDGGR